MILLFDSYPGYYALDNFLWRIKMSAFLGYLIKVGETIFPTEYIALDTYNSSPDQRIDQDSYTDGNGQLVRNILPHTRTKVTFSTIPELHLADKIKIQQLLKRDDTTLTYWNDDKNTYTTGKFYIADPNYPIKRISENDIIYNAISFEIIEY